MRWRNSVAFYTNQKKRSMPEDQCKIINRCFFVQRHIFLNDIGDHVGVIAVLTGIAAHIMASGQVVRAIRIAWQRECRMPRASLTCMMPLRHGRLVPHNQHRLSNELWVC